MPLCLAAAGIVTSLAIDSFTLVWTHSIEKVRWEEDYRVEPAALRLVEARIRGSGAGMEPPPDSRFEHGVWHYDPHLPPLAQLRLTLSPYTTGYDFCSRGRCEPLVDLLPGAARAEVATLSSCPG